MFIYFFSVIDGVLRADLFMPYPPVINLFLSLIRPIQVSRVCNLLTRQSSNTGELLALQQLQAGTATSGDVAQLILDAILGSNGSSVTTADDDNLAVLAALDDGVKSGLGAASELLKLKDTSRAVPQDGLGLINGLLVQLDGLVTTVEAHPSVRDAVLVSGEASVGVLVELVGGDEVSRQDNLDVLGLGLLDQLGNGLGTGLVKERVTNGEVVRDLLEGESHATADDEGVDLVKQVVDELDLVRDLGTTEDGKERSLRGLESLGEVVELLLHEETGGLLGQINANHGRVSTVSSAESIV